MHPVIRRKRQRGSAMVELALCLTGFLMLTMGSMDFGWGVYAYNFCSYAAQDAARWASVHGSQSTSPATVSDVQTYVKNQAVGLVGNQLTITPCWSGNCPASGSPPSGSNVPGSTVTVTVSYQVNPLTGLGLTKPLNVSSTAQFVINH